MIHDSRTEHVEVRLLADPCLWCWEIRDAVDGRLVESSWAGQWTAFDSRDEAEAAGRRRLAERRTEATLAAAAPDPTPSTLPRAS